MAGARGHIRAHDDVLGGRRLAHLPAPLVEDDYVGALGHRAQLAGQDGGDVHSWLEPVRPVQYGLDRVGAEGGDVRALERLLSA